MLRNKNKKKSLSPERWHMRMEGVPCFILGNSPSLSEVDLSLLDNYMTIGINRIFYVYDPTILMWQDLALWVQERKLIMGTKAIKCCREHSETMGGLYTFSLEGRESRLTSTPKKLYGRGSSGSIAYQLSRSLGCNPIALVGMDCCNRKTRDGEITDFYGVNPMHKPHTLTNCVKGLEFIKKSSEGTVLYNCSDSGVFKERLTIEEVVSKLPCKKYSREELNSILIGE